MAQASPRAQGGSLAERRWSGWSLLWWVIPVVGLVEAVLQWTQVASAPTLADWRALQPYVQRQRRHGDLPVVAPRWAQPIARSTLGPNWATLADLAFSDAKRHRYAFEVSLRGARRSEFVDWRPLSETTQGPFTLRRLENPEPRIPRFNFLQEFSPDTVEVYEVDQAQRRPCRWRNGAPRRTGGLGGEPAFPEQRFQCVSHEFVWVGITVIDDQDYRPRRCLWAHPPPQGHLEIRYRGVPLGSRVEGHAGTPFLTHRQRHGPAVELALDVSGERIGLFSHEDSSGWVPFRFATENAPDARVDVSWRVSSAGFDYRHFCFEAVVP